jgi:hypothetical protein
VVSGVETVALTCKCSRLKDNQQTPSDAASDLRGQTPSINLLRNVKTCTVFIFFQRAKLERELDCRRQAA